jgi:hypothetical protein
VGFLPNPQKIQADGLSGGGVDFEAVELGMISVTFRFSRQNFLRQERLSPKRQEAFGIEILRVKRPKTQSLLLRVHAF